jgi:hypothetical protein
VFADVEPEVLQLLVLEAGVSITRRPSDSSLPSMPIEEDSNEDDSEDGKPHKATPAAVGTATRGATNYDSDNDGVQFVDNHDSDVDDDDDDDDDRFAREYRHDIETSARRTSVASSLSLGTRPTGAAVHGRSELSIAGLEVRTSRNSSRGLTIRVDSRGSIGSECSIPSVTSTGSDGFSPRGTLVAINSESNLDEILNSR